MLDSIPEEIKRDSTELLVGYCGSKVHVQSFTYCSGGCINKGGKLSTNFGNFFLKWNKNKAYPGMFLKELDGLVHLKQTESIAIPKVIGAKEAGEYSFILMEYIEQGVKDKKYWRIFGQQLAALHRNTNNSFGWDEDNYIGSLPQKNLKFTKWEDFFMKQRILPMLKIGRDSGKINKTECRNIEVVTSKILTIFPQEKPSLLHGDLWGGNLITTSEGLPCLIDPAVYYGHREVDLAFTQLFGGFDSSFLEEYNEVYPLEPNFYDRIDGYNLYPLLVHLNLFGVGYLNQIKNIISHYK